MNVTQILKLKGSTAVETVSPNATVNEVIGELSRKGIGALVVSGEGGGVDGIVSERDIVRVLGAEGASCLSRRVSEVMTAKVIGCSMADSALSVLERMSKGRFRHMPVVEDGRMVGLLSIGDVVKARISEIESDNKALVEMLHG
ncbi:MAG: CBS domain-containing protein [Pseudomonadota bacterium]